MLFTKKQIRALLIPLLLEQLLNVLIGMVDTVMVASCGEAAVSGVSLVDSINVLVISVFSSLAAGGAVVCAQFLGHRDTKTASLAAKQLFYIVLLVSTVIMGICLALRRQLLSLIFGSIEPEVMTSALSYFLFTLLSYPFLAMYNASAALLRSEGDAKASLLTSVVMNLVNISGNALLIYALNMGVTGAAVATMVSRAVGAAIMQVTLGKPGRALERPRLLRFEWNGSLVRKILGIGVPNGLEGGMFQFGKLILVGMISTFGTVSIAANAVSNSVATFQVLPGMAVGLCMVTVIGQCVGAGAYDQARYYTKYLMKLAYIMMGVLNAVVLLGIPVIVRMYSLTDETAALASTLLTVHGVGCILIWPLSFAFPNVLRAAGDTVFVMQVSAASMIAFRVVMGWLLGSVLKLGVLGVWIAMELDWCVRTACFLLRYRSGRWETKAVV